MPKDLHITHIIFYAFAPQYVHEMHSRMREVHISSAAADEADQEVKEERDRKKAMDPEGFRLLRESARMEAERMITDPSFKPTS